MFLLRKNKKFVIKKKVPDLAPLKYELWVKILCPHCNKKATKTSTLIWIALPVAGLPDTIRCHTCDEVIDIHNIFKKGIEVKQK